MDILEMHRRFDLIIDKTGNPYFTSNEKDSFLQRGEIDAVNSFFGNPKDRYEAEQSDKDVGRIRSLIEEIETTSDYLGRILDTTVNDLLSTEVMYYLNIAVSGADNGCDTGSFNKSRFVRHNDFFAHQNNEFKKGTQEYPVHRYFNGYLKVTPSNEEKVYLTACRYPVKVTLDDPDDLGVAGVNAVSSELPDKFHDEVLMYALRSAGINIREAEFFQMINQEQDKGV